MAILVLTAPLPAQPFVDALRRAAPSIPVWSEADAPDPAAVEAILAWQLPSGVVSRHPRLRVLCSSGAGVDKLTGADDLPPDLPITRVVDPQQGAQMAQYALACALAHTRQLGLYEAQQAAGNWQRHPVRPAAQCRVGVLGLGAIGQSIARAFAAVGYPVTGWSRRPRDISGMRCESGADALPGLLSDSDILVCALPLTPHTLRLLDRRTLAQLPRGAYLINLGRGEHLVEPDLRELIDAGHLSGAALDVFEREPPRSSSWLWRHPAIRMTPHIAAQAGFDAVAEQCLAALASARAGRTPVHAINRTAGY